MHTHERTWSESMLLLQQQQQHPSSTSTTSASGKALRRLPSQCIAKRHASARDLVVSSPHICMTNEVFFSLSYA